MRALGHIWILGLAACSAIVDADSSRLNDGNQCDLDCDDNITCTRDECVNNACQHTPQNDLCDDGFECNPNANNGSGCVPADCDLDCNEPPGCPGESCFDCDIEGYCNDTSDACVYVLRDEDDDGHGVAQVDDQDCSEFDPNADDCDDNDPSRNPSQPEICNNDDTDCDGEEDFTNETSRPCLGETCANPLPITLASGSFTHNGVLGHYLDNLPAFDDPFGNMCSNSEGNGYDVVYRLTVTQAMDIVIEAEATGSPAIDPVLGVRNGAGCSGGGYNYTYTETCHDDVQLADNSSRIYLQNFGADADARTLYVVLKGWDNNDQGPFQLTVTTSPATGPMCGTDSLDISEGGLLVARLGTDTAQVQADVGMCEQNDGNNKDDSVARFDISEPGIQGSGALYVAGHGFLPVMYIRKDLCDGTEVGCVEGSNTNSIGFLGWNLGSTNYVIVDGGDEGDYFFLRYEPPEP